MIRLKIVKQFSSLLCICMALALLCISNNRPMAIASNHTGMTHKKIVEIFGDDFWKQFDLQSLSDISAISFAVSGNCAYQLMENGDLYQLDLQKWSTVFFVNCLHYRQWAFPPKCSILIYMMQSKLK